MGKQKVMVLCMRCIQVNSLMFLPKVAEGLTEYNSKVVIFNKSASYVCRCLWMPVEASNVGLRKDFYSPAIAVSPLSY